MMAHASIRTRLTLLYAGSFFLAGILLVLAGYLLVRHTLTEGLHQLNSSPMFNVASKVLPDKPLLLGEDGRLITVAEFRDQLVAEQQRVQQNALRDLLAQSLIAAGAVGLLACLCGWVLAGRVLRPLHRITDTARRVADRNLGERIHLSGPRDELKELADTFDAMLERLDRAFDGQRRFVANASHELRTPLTVSRTLIQVALGRADASADLRELGQKLLKVNNAQTDLTDRLLALVRSEHAPGEWEPVDLTSTVREVIDMLAPEARAAGVRLDVDCRPAPARGDLVLLDLLVRNLILNGIRHNHRGGWVRVSTGSWPGEARLTVSNTGLVVPAAEIDGIFEPFRRLAERTGDRSGTGLGLSIVRSVARAHGGRVTAAPRPGGGLTVTVAVPRQAGTSSTSAGVMPALRTTPPPTTSTAG